MPFLSGKETNNKPFSMSVGSVLRHLKMEVFKGMEVNPHLWWIAVVIEY